MIESKIIRKVSDFNKFFNSFIEYIDTTEDYRTSFFVSPKRGKEFFGELNQDIFTIYHVRKFFLFKRVSLKIKGNYSDKNINFRVVPYNIFGSHFSSSMMIIFSFILMDKLNVLIGLGLLIYSLLILWIYWRNINKSKKRFIEIIDSLNIWD